jgi:hypothetical protein
MPRPTLADSEVTAIQGEASANAAIDHYNDPEAAAIHQLV